MRFFEINAFDAGVWHSAVCGSVQEDKMSRLQITPVTQAVSRWGARHVPAGALLCSCGGCQTLSSCAQIMCTPVMSCLIYKCNNKVQLTMTVDSFYAAPYLNIWVRMTVVLADATYVRTSRKMTSRGTTRVCCHKSIVVI